jgi:hypothetical protein
VRPAGDLHTVEERLEDKEAELEEAQQQTEEALARARCSEPTNSWRKS